MDDVFADSEDADRIIAENDSKNRHDTLCQVISLRSTLRLG